MLAVDFSVTRLFFLVFLDLVFFFVKNLNTSVDDFFFLFLVDWDISNKVTVVKYLNISLHHHHHHLRRNDDGVIVSARVFFHV